MAIAGRKEPNFIHVGVSHVCVLVHVLESRIWRQRLRLKRNARKGQKAASTMPEDTLSFERLSMFPKPARCSGTGLPGTHVRSCLRLATLAFKAGLPAIILEGW